jgi:Zn-dependent peptidase ImmA (M78 family)
MTPGLIYQIRHAHERRGIARDLLSEMGEVPNRFSFGCKREEDPVEVGARLRGLLGISVETQRQWSKDTSGYAALNGWKDAAENSGAIVFQASKRDLNHVRGFSIHADILPVIMLTSEDVPVARAFTLMHELAHVGLREGGVCDLHDGDIELFCNQVAAAVLMPPKELLGEIAAMGNPAKDGWPDAALRKLARLFSVSEQALVLRLVALGAVSWDFYRKMRPEFDLRNRQAKSREGKEEQGFVPPHKMSMARNGVVFTRLVLEAYHRRAITSHRAATYLGISFDGLGKVEQEMAHRFMMAS